MFKFQLKKLVDKMGEEENEEIFLVIKNPKEFAKLDPEDISKIIEYAIKNDKVMALLNMMNKVQGDNLSTIIEFIGKNNISLSDYLPRDAYRETLLENEIEFKENAVRYTNKSLLLELAYAMALKPVGRMGEINSLISNFLDEKRVSKEKEWKEYKSLDGARLEKLILTCTARNIVRYIFWISPEKIAHFIDVLVNSEPDKEKILDILKEISKTHEEQTEKVKQEFLRVFKRMNHIEVKCDYLIAYYEIFCRQELNMDIIDQIITSKSLSSTGRLMGLVGMKHQREICLKYQNDNDLMILANLACTTNCEETQTLRRKVIENGNLSLVSYVLENTKTKEALLALILEFVGADYYLDLMKVLEGENEYCYDLAMNYIFDKHVEHLFPEIYIAKFTNIRAYKEKNRSI